MELTLLQWSLAILCAIMIGMGKTGVGGIGTLVVPIMAFIFGGKPSAGLVLPMLVMADVFSVAYYHRSADWKIILKILPWAFAGIIVGLIVGNHISSHQFKQLIGILVIISLVVMLWLEYRKKRTLKANKEILPHKPWIAIPFGIMGGFSTMIGNAAGPIMSVYLLSKNMPKKTFIGTAAWFFLIVNVFKMPLQIWGWHTITLKTLIFNLMLLPAIATGAFLGIIIVHRIPEKGYRWFIFVATIVSALALIIP